MLDPALDKLRNKELSFGCIVGAVYPGTLLKDIFTVINTKPLLERLGTEHVLYSVKHATYFVVEDKDIDTIYGHPLTGGRICYLLDEYFRDPLTKHDSYVTLSKAKEKVGAFLAYYKLYGQNELQRMNHEKRPELKELLIQFSNYISTHE